MFAGGTAVCGLGTWMHHGHVGAGFLAPVLLGLGGLALVFGSCEAMIKCVEALGERENGTTSSRHHGGPRLQRARDHHAGLRRGGGAARGLRGTCLTLHVSALIFGVYSALLPKNETGHALLPSAITKLGADLLACAAGCSWRWAP
ncbi:MAG: hypothetical protein IPN17_24850 [Deltaproteobacteria bacterium]|nr:hypothetical protein [Deltaproteobacteria bacterium]